MGTLLRRRDDDGGKLLKRVMRTLTESSERFRFAREHDLRQSEQRCVCYEVGTSMKAVSQKLNEHVYHSTVFNFHV